MGNVVETLIFSLAVLVILSAPFVIGHWISRERKRMQIEKIIGRVKWPDDF